MILIFTCVNVLAVKYFIIVLVVIRKFIHFALKLQIGFADLKKTANDRANVGVPIIGQ